MAGKFLQLALFLLLADLAMCAQEAVDLLQPDSAQEHTTASYASDLTGDVAPLATGSDQIPRNMLIGGYTLSGALDRFAGNNLFEESFAPHIALQETRSKMQYAISYAPGVERYAGTTLLSQDANGVLDWTPLQHTRIHLRQDYSLTIDPFAQMQKVFTTSQPSPLTRPNEFIITTDTRPRTFDSEAGVSRDLDEHSTVSVGGSYVDRGYDNVSSLQSAALIGVRILTASASYARQFNAANTGAIQFQWSDMSFSDQSRTHSYALFYSHALKLNPTMGLTFYAGPAYTTTYSLAVINYFGFLLPIPVTQRGWKPICGASYNWTGDRNAFRAEFLRRVSDGGGLMGAITLTGGSAEFRRNLSEVWSINVGVNVSDDQALGLLPGSDQFLRTVGATLALQRRLTEKSSLRMGYSRSWQSGQLQGLLPGGQERLEIAIDYSFTRPVGR